MTRHLVFAVCLTILPQCILGQTNLDSLLNKVMAQYNIKDYFEYEGLMQRFDSARTQKFQVVKMYHKIKKPSYHINLGNLLETLLIGNYGLQINHKDSLIIVERLSDSLMKIGSKGTIDDLLSSFKNIDTKLSVEKEDSFFVLVRLNLSAFPNYYMSFKIDKRTNLIVQNQFYKGELAYGKTKFYFYQIDYFNYKRNNLSTIELKDLLVSHDKERIVFHPRFKNYKVKYTKN